MKTMMTMVVHEDIHVEDNDDEDIHLKTMECEDIVSFVVSFSSFQGHGNHRTIKWGPNEQSQLTEVMLNQNPMSSSEDNESKSYPKLDESALLVASPSQAVACV